MPHRVDRVVVPVRDLVHAGAVAVALELLQPELLVGERIMQILANKQRIFDAFADRSVAAEQVDQAFTRETMDKIVRDELRKYAGVR